MTGNRVVVNGAVMDRQFFEDNVAEANSIEWNRMEAMAASEHRHCIICTKPIVSFPAEEAYRSGNRFLCAHCYKTYLKLPRQSQSN
jgi:uncharacterized protein with PIN domain